MDQSGPQGPIPVCSCVEHASSEFQPATAEGLQDLEEWRFFFDSEERVGRGVTELGLGDASLLLNARSRRAWSAVRLLQVALFCGDSPQRYGGFPRVPGVGQAHALRLQHLEGVKNLQFQLTAREEQEKLGENLFTDEVETEEVVSKDSETSTSSIRSCWRTRWRVPARW